MAGPSLRNEAVDFIQAEIERVGVEKLDRAAVVRRFLAKGASRARIYDWIKVEMEAARNPPPDSLEEDMRRAEAEIAASQRAAVISQLPSKDRVTRLAGEASAAIKEARSASVPDSPLVIVESPPIRGTSSGMTPVPAVAVPAPRGIGIVMSKLERAIETVDQCISYSYGENGKLRNPRMALAASDGLRRCLETALKLHEAVDNVQAVQRFMDEIMAALRETSPEVAAAVVEKLQGVTGRWAK